eukprot:4613520-Prymnesium_polylepis.1
MLDGWSGISTCVGRVLGGRVLGTGVGDGWSGTGGRGRVVGDGWSGTAGRGRLVGDGCWGR